MNSSLLRIIYICTTLLLTWGLEAQTTDATTKAAQYYYRGALADSQGEHKAALALFRYAHYLAPSDPNYAFALGNSYMQARQSEQAIVLLKKAYELDSTNRDYALTYARVLQRTDVKKAESIVESWLSRNPGDEEGGQLLGSIYIREGNFQKTIDLFSKLRKENKSIYSEYLRLSILCARLYYSQDKHGEAEKELAELIQAFPSESHAKIMAIQTMYENGRHSSAKTYLDMLRGDETFSRGELRSLEIPYLAATQDSVRWEEALRKELEDPEVEAKEKFDHWQTYLMNKAVGDTLPSSYNWVFERIVSLHPTATEVAYGYAKQLETQGENKRCIEILLPLTKTYPEERDVWVTLMSKLIDEKRYNELKDITEQGIQQHPSEWRIYFLGSAYYVMQDLSKEGRKYLEKYLPDLEKNGAEPMGVSLLYGSLGDLYEGIDRKEAYKCYDKALAIYEDNAEVLNNYAYFLALEGKDLEKAERMAQRGLKVKENDANLLDTYAWIQYLRGRHTIADIYIRRAIEAAGEDINGVYYDHYGDILLAKGEVSEAISNWTKAIGSYSKELSNLSGKDKAVAKQKKEKKDKIKRLESLVKKHKQ